MINLDRFAGTPDKLPVPCRAAGVLTGETDSERIWYYAVVPKELRDKNDLTGTAMRLVRRIVDDWRAQGCHVPPIEHIRAGCREAEVAFEGGGFLAATMIGASQTKIAVCRACFGFIDGYYAADFEIDMKLGPRFRSFEEWEEAQRRAR